MKAILLILMSFVTVTLNAQWTNQSLGWVWENVNTMCFLNETQGYAAGDYGAFVKTTNGGSTWNTISTGTFYYISGMYFFDINTGFVVNTHSDIIKTVDGGSNWTVKYTQEHIQLEEILFINSTTGFAVGGEGGICTVVKTTDAGNTWTPQTVNGYYGWLKDIDFPTSSTGYAVGIAGGIIKSTNGGSTWNKLTSNVTEWLMGVDFIDANTGYVVGESGSLLKTTDGGTTWISQVLGTSCSLKDIYFLNANTGYVVGNNSNGGVIYKTVNGGVTWTLDYTTPYTWFITIEIPTNNVAYAGGMMGMVSKNASISEISETVINKCKVTVYPNPCNETTTLLIDPEYNASNLTLRISDITGKEISRMDNIYSNEISIDLKSISHGIYYYTIEDASTVLSRGKLVRN